LKLIKENDFSYTFEQGDTILIEVRPLKKSVLRVEFKNEQGGIQYGAINVKKEDCFCKRIVIDNAGIYTLSIVNRYLKKIGFGKCHIKVVRNPKVISKVFNVIRDTIYEPTDSIIDVQLERIDTTLYQIIDYKSSVTNTLNLEQSPFVSIPISIPENLLDSIQYIAYWIGLTGVDTSNYNLIAERVTLPEVFNKQVSTPVIAAYSLGIINSLPATYNQNVKFAFTDLKNKLLFEKKRNHSVLVGNTKFSPNNFGKINLATILSKYPLSLQRVYEQKHQIPSSDNYQFFLSCSNSSTINTYPICIKAVGMGIRKTYAYQKKEKEKKIKTINIYKVPYTSKK